MSKKRKAQYSKSKLNAIKNDPIWLIVRYYANEELHPLLREIKKRKYDDLIRKTLINYLIVRTVSIFENFLLNHAKRFSDAHRDIASELFLSVRIDQQIGDQVISTFSFMNLKDVKNVFSTLLKADFFSKIKKESVEYATDYCYEQEHIHWASPLHKNWDKFEKIFVLRDDIVHHNKLANLKWKEFRDMIESVMDFCMCSMMIIR